MFRLKELFYLPNARFFSITRLFACKHFDFHRIFYLDRISKVPNRSNANIMIFTLVQFWPNWSSFIVFFNTKNISIFGNINLLFSVVWKLTCFSLKSGLVSESPIPNKRWQITLLWINSLTTVMGGKFRFSAFAN